MGSFRDLPLHARKATMGDEAEGVFEAVYPQGFVRFGLDRPPVRVQDLPLKIRYTPDYLTTKGLVEVQGFGRDQRFKLKDDKLAALELWHADFRVDLFLWDSANQRYGWVRLPELIAALEDDQRAAFDGGTNPYWWLRADQLPIVGGWYGRDERMKVESVR